MIYWSDCTGRVLCTIYFIHPCLQHRRYNTQMFYKKVQQLSKKEILAFHVCIIVRGGGGHLYLKLDIIRVKKKNHVIRVVFQDQAMYARTSFRGAKTRKIGKKKWYVFGHMTNFGKNMTDKLKKNAYKNAYLGSIFIPEKYVFRVCFESPFTRMISNLKYKWPPPPGL